MSILISVHRPMAFEFAGMADLQVAMHASRPLEGDTIHVTVASGPLYDRLHQIQAESGPDDTLILDLRLVRDTTVTQLVHALIAANQVEQGLDALHADAIGLAIVTRVLGMCQRTKLPATNRRRAPLQKWRLKRVVDYVDAHLGRPITLPDLAAAAGLTRMHFAAQFRAAVGMRPHDYILQRRIDRACELLRNPQLALVEVALSVGFQTQAHFTTVFRRFAGDTPHRWRSAAMRS